MSIGFSRIARVAGIASAALTIAAFGLLAAPAHAVNLTGVTLQNVPLTNFWNTQGGDSAFNLYLSQGGSPLNVGNGEGASISVPLQEGDNVFNFAGDSNGDLSLVLALYFDGDNTTNRIAAQTEGAVTSVLGGPLAQAFTGYSGPVKAVNLTNVNGSGTILYSVGNTTITLTDFEYLVGPFNPVSPFDSEPGGSLSDNVGSFTLNVQVAVPETSSAALALPVVLVGAAGLALARRRRKTA